MTAPEPGSDDTGSTVSGDASVTPATHATSPNGEATSIGSSIPTVHIRELRQGHMPGERYVRIHRPFHETFREASSDTLVARESVFAPRGALNKLWAKLRWSLVGRPLASAQLAHERLSKTKALAVFSSDALSSSAYATEEILRILVLAGAGALALTLPVALAIGLLLVIVGVSYRQTIKAYPHGGGSYIVTK